MIDHAAERGSGRRDTGTFHRIDPAGVKTEVEAAGFKPAHLGGIGKIVEAETYICGKEKNKRCNKRSKTSRASV